MAVRPWTPEVRGTLLATQVTTSCLGFWSPNCPYCPRQGLAGVSFSGVISGPGRGLRRWDIKVGRALLATLQKTTG